MAVTGVSMDVNAEMADMRTSSLTRTFPCTRVCVRGDGGTVMYVDTCVKKHKHQTYMKNYTHHMFRLLFHLLALESHANYFKLPWFAAPPECGCRLSQPHHLGG